MLLGTSQVLSCQKVAQISEVVPTILSAMRRVIPQPSGQKWQAMSKPERVLTDVSTNCKI